jgi:hypothetical protein
MFIQTKKSVDMMANEQSDAKSRRKSSWLILDLPHIEFPNSCCVCGAETLGVFKTTVSDARLIETISSSSLDVKLPCCDACNSKIRRKKMVRLLGVFGSVIGAGCYAGSQFIDNFFTKLFDVEFMPWFVIVFFVVVFGFKINRLLPAFYLPAKLRYKPAKNELHIKFKQSSYAEKVSAFQQAIQAQHDQ